MNGFHVRAGAGTRKGEAVYGVGIIQEVGGVEDRVVYVTTTDPDERDRLTKKFADFLHRLNLPFIPEKSF